MSRRFRERGGAWGGADGKCSFQHTGADWIICAYTLPTASFLSPPPPQGDGAVCGWQQAQEDFKVEKQETGLS